MVKDDGGVAAPPPPEESLSRRLKSAAFSRKLLSRSQAKIVSPMEPSKLVLKQRGKDIVKKGQRKNKFLFSLPGLLAPVSGGKIGELANLNTRNPVLYLEFPKGRMKLFGTVVYPKNKYLTLQFSRSSKGVQCEDSFENMVVFSEAWWIGTPEENPQEIRLEFPEDFNGEKNLDCDFKGGAGVASQEITNLSTQVKESHEQSSPEIESSDGAFDSNDMDAKENIKIVKQETSVRQSARTAGKSFKFTESSGDDSSSSLADETEVSEVIHGRRSGVTKRLKLTLEEDPVLEECEEKLSQTTGKVKARSNPKTSEEKSGGKGSALVQATLSAMYDKVKKVSKGRACGTSPSTRGSGANKPSPAVKRALEPSNDSSPARTDDTDQETEDSDEDWTS